jgi:CRISPR-associated protein Csd1
MILQDLVAFYDRQLAVGEIAPPGFEQREIPYIIEINENGKYLSIQTTWSDAKKKSAKLAMVPAMIKRASGVASNLLWDSPSYVLGIAPEDKFVRPERLLALRAAFVERVEELAGICSDKSLAALIKFLRKDPPAKLLKDRVGLEMIADGRNVSFRLKGELRLISERPAVRKAIAKLAGQIDDSAQRGICLVTGEEDVIARVHPAIQGVKDAQSSGGNLVSYNQSAFESYGKTQSFNASVGQRAAFAYTAALNQLLGKRSKQKIQIADTTVVFWTDDQAEDSGLLQIIDLMSREVGGDRQARADFEAEQHEAMRKLYDWPWTGKKSTLKNQSGFYVLGLAPNMARISVRFYLRLTVGETVRNLQQHFDDLKQVIPPFESNLLPIPRLLRALAVRGESERFHRSLGAALFMASLTGETYPEMLMNTVLERIGRDHDRQSQRQYDSNRFAILKACLVRKQRNAPKKYTYHGILKQMDETNKDVAYRLGRLFAVMENVQYLALGRVNATIRDRYFTAAATRPGTVFPQLMTLMQHHISKARGKGGGRMDRMVGEIIDPLDPKEAFPRVFTPEQRGQFGIGYYQQKQEIFRKLGAEPADDGTDTSE